MIATLNFLCKGLRGVLIFLLILPSLVTLGTFWLAWRSEREMRQGFDWVNHTFEVQARIADVRRDVEAVERGLRSFLILSDTRDASRSGELADHIPLLIADLMQLTQDNPRQVLQCQALEVLVKARLAQVKGIEAPGGQIAAADVEQAVEDSERFIESTGQLFQALSAEEERLLKIRQGTQKDKAHRQSVITGALCVLSSVVLALFVCALVRFWRLERMITMCAWSHTIEYEGQWVSFEAYLKRRFGIATSHGIAPGQLQKLQDELSSE